MFPEMPKMPVTMTAPKTHQDQKNQICQDALTQSLPLQSFGLKLRAYRDEDLSALLDIASYPTFSFEGLDGTRKMTQAFIATAIQSQYDDGSGERKSYALAIEDAARREVIGHIAAKRETETPNSFALSYFMNPIFQGHRLVKAAAVLLIDGLFTSANAQLIRATASDNPAAQNILTWLGFESSQSPSCYRLERARFQHNKAALHKALNADR